jgi:hypothetical protein
VGFRGQRTVEDGHEDYSLEGRKVGEVVKDFGLLPVIVASGCGSCGEIEEL